MKLLCHSVFVGLLILAGMRIGSTEPAAAATASDAEWERTVAAAKKEGKVSVFLYQRDNIEAAVKSFEKRYPEIQVTTASTPAAQTGPRIMAERRAGKFLWDICICGPTTPFAVVLPAKALDPIKPALLLPEVVDQSKWWGGKHHYMDEDANTIFVFLGSVEMPNLYYHKPGVIRRSSNPTSICSGQSGAARFSRWTLGSLAGSGWARVLSHP